MNIIKLGRFLMENARFRVTRGRFSVNFEQVHYKSCLDVAHVFHGAYAFKKRFDNLRSKSDRFGKPCAHGFMKTPWKTKCVCPYKLFIPWVWLAEFIERWTLVDNTVLG